MQSKPASRGNALGNDFEEEDVFGGREPILATKLMDDDDAEVSVRHCCGFLRFPCYTFNNLLVLIFCLCVILTSALASVYIILLYFLIHTAPGWFYWNCTI